MAIKLGHSILSRALTEADPLVKIALTLTEVFVAMNPDHPLYHDHTQLKDCLIKTQQRTGWDKAIELRILANVYNTSPIGCAAIQYITTKVGGQTQTRYTIEAEYTNISFLTLNEWAAVFAHEIGHFYHKHLSSTKEAEFEADAYAASFGYGLDLANVLRKLEPHVLPIYDESKSLGLLNHPYPQERIARLSA